MTLTYHPSWASMLDKAKDSPYFKELFEILAQDKAVPHLTDYWFKPLEIDLDKLQVVILGDEPISMNNNSNGLAWGVESGTPFTNSAKVMYEELRRSNVIGSSEEFDPTMQKWFSQNVLLWNTSPTVRIKEPGSHQHLWRRFTTNLVQRISERATIGKPIFWFLWGKYPTSMLAAIKEHEVIPNSSIDKAAYMKSNIVFMAGHPEADMLKEEKEFIGCNHFKVLSNLIRI